MDRPSNLSCAEAELSVVGAVLLVPERLFDAREIVKPDDFEDGRLGAIFRAVCVVEDAGGPVDFITVAAQLNPGKVAPPGEQTWGAFLARIASSVTSAAFLVKHCKLVQDTATLRRLVLACRHACDEAGDVRPNLGEVAAFLDGIESRVFQIGQAAQADGQAVEIGQVVDEVVGHINSPDQRGEVYTGIHDLDQLLHGLGRGDLVLIAARPSVGKTALGLQVSLNCAREGVSVLVLSLEMGREQLVERLLSNLGGINTHVLRSRSLTAEDTKALEKASAELRALPISLVSGNATTVSRLRGIARRRTAKKRLDLIVVDYLQLMTDPQVKDRVQEVSAISRALKCLARELEVPIIALSQLSRAGDGGRPKLSHLRDSGALEQDADSVVMLWVEEKDGPLCCSVEKNRHGRTGDMRLAFRRRYCEIAGLAQRSWGVL